MPNGTLTIDEEMRAFELAQARREAAEASAPEEETAAEAPTAPRVNAFEAGIMLALAIVNDGLDYLIIGSIPIIGDIFDGVLWGCIVWWANARGLRKPPFWGFTGAVELIPFGDIIPTYTLMVLWLIAYNRKSS
ncbi:MAG: hypothetical protein HYS44_02260 [Candidatus Niyogibacteria bacterium]|nr:hypothetical protein [Candidatus Niyogibacteria bacterium]